MLINVFLWSDQEQNSGHDMHNCEFFSSLTCTNHQQSIFWHHLLPLSYLLVGQMGSDVQEKRLLLVQG